MSEAQLSMRLRRACWVGLGVWVVIRVVGESVRGPAGQPAPAHAETEDIRHYHPRFFQNDLNKLLYEVMF